MKKLIILLSIFGLLGVANAAKYKCYHTSGSGTSEKYIQKNGEWIIKSYKELRPIGKIGKSGNSVVGYIHYRNRNAINERQKSWGEIINYYAPVILKPHNKPCSQARNYGKTVADHPEDLYIRDHDLWTSRTSIHRVGFTKNVPEKFIDRR